MMSQCWLIVGDSEWADSGWTWGPARSCDETCVLRARLSKLSRFKLELQVGSLPVSCASLASLSWAAFKLCPYTFYPEKCDKISPPFLPKFSPFLRPQVGIEGKYFPRFFQVIPKFSPFPKFWYHLSPFPIPFVSCFRYNFYPHFQTLLIHVSIATFQHPFIPVSDTLFNPCSTTLFIPVSNALFIPISIFKFQ